MIQFNYHHHHHYQKPNQIVRVSFLCALLLPQQTAAHKYIKKQELNCKERRGEDNFIT